MPTSSATNRLTTAGTLYDAEGNLVLWNSGPSYEYDAFNRMRRFRGGVAPGSEEWVFAYTADDERVFSARVGGGGTVWSLRGLDNQLLREWRAENGKHSFRDYVWTGRNLLAKIERTPAAGSPGWSEETRHAALDHLGSVRLWTDAAGANLPGFIYYPFGKQLNGTVDDEQMRFTGHERDLWNTTSANDDLDYMHARFRSPLTGRFLSVDPVLNLKKTLGRPQAWNRYAYVFGNPLRFVDPTGEIAIVFDFKDSTLSPRQQALVIQGIKAAYKRAGIKDVQVFLSTDKNRPEANPSGGPNAVVELSYRISVEGGGFGGWTPSNNDASVSVAAANWAGSPEGRLNMLINVGAHESAHGLRALTEYDWDAGSGPRGMSDSIMEQVWANPAEARILGKRQRDFHPDDAALLRERLNAQEDNK